MSRDAISVSAVVDAASSAPVADSRLVELDEIALTIFGRAPHNISYPGGTSRNTVRVHMGDGEYIFSKRGKRGSARIEGIVLRRLSDTGLVPKLKAQVGEWVVQECMAGERLPLYLDRRTCEVERSAVVGNALESLLTIKEAAQSAGLERWLPTIGADPSWMRARIDVVHKLSAECAVASPSIDRDKLAEVLAGERNDFMKFDARPGNALYTGGRVAWIDWEDCGFGHSVEDLAFVLGDEWTALSPESEDDLIEIYLPRFSNIPSLAEAYRHFLIYGTFHMVTRLRMAFSLFQQSHGWWDRGACLRGDKVGNTSIEVTRLCDRIVRWSSLLPELRGLMPWVSEIQSKFSRPHLAHAPMRSVA